MDVPNKHAHHNSNILSRCLIDSNVNENSKLSSYSFDVSVIGIHSFCFIRTCKFRPRLDVLNFSVPRASNVLKLFLFLYRNIQEIIGIRHLYRHPCQCLKRKEDYVLRSLNVFTVSSETTIND